MRVYILSLQLCLLSGFYLWTQPSQAEDAYTELNTAYGPTITSLEKSDNWRGLFGGGLLSIQTPFGESKSYALPLLSLSYRQIIYWHFGEAGVYVLKSSNRHARLAIAIKARRGFDPATYPSLTGMSKRDTSIEAGVHGSLRTNSLLISYGFFHDISNHSNGNSASLNLSHPIRLAPRLHLVPSIGMEWLSANVVNYYYDVTTSEATNTRHVYTGTASTNLRLGLMLNYRLSHDWSLFAGLGYMRLGQGIRQSTIVIRNSITAVNVGAGWHF